jgi:hypothetical protein
LIFLTGRQAGRRFFSEAELEGNFDFRQRCSLRIVNAVGYTGAVDFYFLNSQGFWKKQS